MLRSTFVLWLVVRPAPCALSAPTVSHLPFFASGMVLLTRIIPESRTPHGCSCHHPSDPTGCPLLHAVPLAGTPCPASPPSPVATFIHSLIQHFPDISDQKHFVSQFYNILHISTQRMEGAPSPGMMGETRDSFCAGCTSGVFELPQRRHQGCRQMSNDLEVTGGV